MRSPGRPRGQGPGLSQSLEAGSDSAQVLDSSQGALLAPNPDQAQASRDAVLATNILDVADQGRALGAAGHRAIAHEVGQLAAPPNGALERLLKVRAILGVGLQLGEDFWQSLIESGVLLEPADDARDLVTEAQELNACAVGTGIDERRDLLQGLREAIPKAHAARCVEGNNQLLAALDRARLLRLELAAFRRAAGRAGLAFGRRNVADEVGLQDSNRHPKAVLQRFDGDALFVAGELLLACALRRGSGSPG
jgi:hypothetical protein